MIHEDLKPLARPLAFFKPDPKNARRHGKKNLKAITTSLEDHGQVKAIVCLHDGTVIAGNGTLQAAKRLGWTELAAVIYPDAEKAKAFAIQDNRTAELAEWDEDALRESLTELNAKGVDLTALGFDDVDLKTVMVAGHTRTLGLDDAFSALPTGDKEPFEQMTFTLHTSQASVVRAAMEALAAKGAAVSDVNANRNGNLLTAVCAQALRGGA